MNCCERCLRPPSLELTVAPFRQVVHVLKQFRPSHDTWCCVWSHKVRASAFWESSNLLAHVDANTSKLVLKLRSMLQVLSHACFVSIACRQPRRRKRCQ